MPKRYPRRYWTRERVLEGLRRFYRDTGELPTGAKAYHARRLSLGTLARRRYPPFMAVMDYWPSFVAAWKEAGCDSEPAFKPRAQPLPEEFAREVGAHNFKDRTNERHGRLVVRSLQRVIINKREWAVAYWLCDCDCGGTRVVKAGTFHPTNCCRECAAAIRLKALEGSRRRGTEKANRRRQIWFSTPEIQARLLEIITRPETGSIAAYAREIGWPKHQLYKRANQLKLSQVDHVRGRCERAANNRAPDRRNAGAPLRVTS